MGLIDWIKRSLDHIKTPDTNTSNNDTPDNSKFSEELVRIIHINPNVYLAHKAARLCIGKDVDEDLDKRMKHLEGVIGVNKHESVAEHTNVIAVILIHKETLIQHSDEFAQFMSVLKYCNVVKSRHNEPNYIYLLIGGSVRAYIHAIREIAAYNYYKQYLDSIVYQSIEKCFLKSLLEEGSLDENKCTYLPNGEIELVRSSITQIKNKYENIEEENYDATVSAIYDPQEIIGEHVDRVYMSPINDIYEQVKKYDFALFDVYSVATLSFVFHDISRSCSHQLVRHRNAISQESQRYVLHDYTYKDFINPIELNREEKYSDKRYKEVMEKTISIVNRGFSDYKWLIDRKVTKEDARAFLPTNVTTKLMMSMTYRNYAMFLHLRLDKAAQKEIRNIAEESVSLVMDIDKVDDFISFLMRQPNLKKSPIEAPLVDEIIEEYIEPKPIEVKTEEDAQILLEKQELYKKKEMEL